MALPKKIEEMFALVIPDGDGGEGIPGILVGNEWYPCVGGDLQRILSMWKHLKPTLGTDVDKVSLRKFSQMTDLTELLK